MSLDEYNRLKKLLERLRREADVDLGSKQAREEQLKSKFGCSSLEEAEKEIERRRIELEQLKAACDRLKEAFNQTFGDKL